MKKAAATMAVMFFATFSFAQRMPDKNVPANVKSTFQREYPRATKVKWYKEGDKYEASFDQNNRNNSVLMDGTGNVVETEVEIELIQLPKEVLEYVKTHYPGKQAKEGAKITDAKGMVTYEVEIEGVDLIFDSNGRFLEELKG